jgi:hypothetical protein
LFLVKIDALKTDWLHPLDDEDVHTVAGALKLFLRELPEPLIPVTHFSAVLSLTCKFVLIFRCCPLVFILLAFLLCLALSFSLKTLVVPLPHQPFPRCQIPSGRLPCDDASRVSCRLLIGQQ